jgi:hypothetical protein
MVVVLLTVGLRCSPHCPSEQSAYQRVEAVDFSERQDLPMGGKSEVILFLFFVAVLNNVLCFSLPKK